MFWKFEPVMMKRILLSVAALFGCGAVMAQNIINLGVEAGYDHSWLKETVFTGRRGGGDSQKCGMNGFHVGPTVRYDFSDGRYYPSVTAGLTYQFLASSYPLGMEKGEYRDYVDNAVRTLKAAGGMKCKVRNVLYSHSLQIPVNARYTYRPHGYLGVFVFTGPMLNFYMARYSKDRATCNYNGKRTGELEYTNKISNEILLTSWVDGEKTITDNTDPDAPKETDIFNLYWNFGAGVNFFGQFSATVSFDACLTNQSNVTKLADANYDQRDKCLKISLGYTF